MVIAMDERRRIFLYELIGMFFIIILGSLLHFTFELSGYQAIVGVFSAVNESTWEHLKLSYWPALAYALIEYRYLKKLTKNFVTAKTVGIYLMPILITAFFYSYTAVIEDSLTMDILIFILAIILGQLASYRLLTSSELLKHFVKISLVAVVVLGFAFLIFTFYPPQLPIFQDPVTGGYGIINH